MDCLTDFTIGKNVASERPFCVVGITNQDLFTEKNNLFIAGLMAGRSHVAVLSFLRYHPHVKMSPAQHWWEYGYASKQSSYSYFKPDTMIEFIGTKGKSLRKRKRTLQLLHNIPIPQSAASKRELLRRASKLLVRARDFARLPSRSLHLLQVSHEWNWPFSGRFCIT